MNWVEVMGALESCWQAIKLALPVIRDIGLFAISAYTFRLTVLPKKLKFINFARHFEAFSGEWVSVTLENRSLCPVVIRSIELVIDSKCMEIFSSGASDEAIIIDIFKTATIKMEPYTSIISENGLVKINSAAYKDMFLIVKTSRNTQRIYYEKTSPFWNRRNKKWRESLAPTTVCRNTYNGKIVVPQVRYALSFVDGRGEIQTIFIHKHGAMSSELFGYNGLSQELVEDEQALRAHFEAEFSARNMTCYIERVDDLFESTEEEVKQ